MSILRTHFPGLDFEVISLKRTFYFDEAIPFDRESWCGVGVVLSDDEVKRFDSV